MLGLALGAPGLVVTAPRAVGVRLPYGAAPAPVRTWVEQELGSPVVAVDVNLPTLNDFRVRESRRMLEAVRSRAGRPR